MLECSRLWLVKIKEWGVSTFNFNGVRKRSQFIAGIKNSGYVSIIVSISDNDCIIHLDGRVLVGKIIKSCPINDTGNGYQYTAKFKDTVYRFSVIPGTKLAVLEEIQ